MQRDKKKLFLWTSASIVPWLSTVSTKSCPLSSRWLITVGGGGGGGSSSGGGGSGDTGRRGSRWAGRRC